MLPHRKYNIIIFGASGFCGKHAVEEIVKTVKAAHSEIFTWAVAGRSLDKINEMLCEITKVTGVDLEHVEKVIAEVSNPDSLEAMARQCQILINTVGPYALYGEAVIKACIKSGTHHIDLSAESQNLTEMQILYHTEAEAAGVYVIGSCGFDSIPNECGINYMQKELNGDLNSVESYLYIGSHLWTNKIKFGTWTSLLHFYAKFKKLRPLLKELFTEELPKPKYELKTNILVRRHSVGETGWCVPFPHPDLWAVERSQHYFHEKKKQWPVQFKAYLKQSNIFVTLLVGIGCLFLGLLLKFNCGVYLMDRFPRFFSAGLISRKGPTRAQMEAFNFSFTLIGKGWKTKMEASTIEHQSPPDQTVILKVNGVNPAYGASSTCLIQAALTMLAEFDYLPSTGGVYTPGIAFANTSIVQRLHKHGLTFNFLTHLVFWLEITNMEQDCEKIQNNLDSLVSWADQNQLNINVNKTIGIVLSKR